MQYFQQLVEAGHVNPNSVEPPHKTLNNIIAHRYSLEGPSVTVYPRRVDKGIFFGPFERVTEDDMVYDT